MKAAALPIWGFTLIVLGYVPATAQQITGVPGSPSATTTIDGRQWLYLFYATQIGYGRKDGQYHFEYDRIRAMRRLCQ